MTSKEKRLFFNDGYVCHRDQVILSSQSYEDEGTAFSRVSMVRNLSSTTNGEWYYANFDDIAFSVTYLQKDKLSFFMGQNGNVLVNGQGRRYVETIPDAGDYGYLLRIRVIGDCVYVCGMTGQVLERADKGWIHIDKDLLGTEGLDFEDIDGSGPNDIYVVGMKGAIYHYNGNVWQQLDSPTNRPLSNVRCLSKDEVYVCGDNGNLFCGNKDKWWTFIGDSDIDRNFWGLETFLGKVYTAYAGGIMVYDGTGLKNVDFQLEKKIGCHRLHANDGVLWSFGIDDLAMFDGSKWRLITCPLNV